MVRFPAALTVAMVGVAAISCSRAHSDSAATRWCRGTHFTSLHDYGISFTVKGKPDLVAAYMSTGRVLDSWDPSNQEHPTFALWQGEADSRPMAACFFDGSFRTGDGRSFERALVETDGKRFILVIADTRRILRVSQPPNN